MINFKVGDYKFENIETVLFDKDGTIIDLHYLWGKMTELRAQAVVEYYNLDKELFERLSLCLGFNINTQKMLKDGITALYSRVKIIDIFSKCLNEMGINATIEEITKIFDEVNGIFYPQMQKYMKPIEPAVNFIKKIKKHNPNIKIAIVTSDTKESTNLTIEHFNWHDLFDFVAGREMSSQTKESGALTLIALNELKADSKKAIMFGDTPMDYESAVNAGVEKVILIETGQMDKEELQKTTPVVISSLDEIEIY